MTVIMDEAIKKGIIFDIQKFCLHDGPGIRTTVFLKGCNLRCKWCHNPESLSKGRQLSFNDSKCVLCGECERVCLSKAHEINNEKHIVHFERCTACGACVDNCVYDALKIIGREATIEEILREVEKDRRYYEESGGGMTLSGGEATLQFDFALELLKEAKKRGLHTCLETNGVLNGDNLFMLEEYVDVILLDYKLTDDRLHREYTGSGNHQVIKSLEVLDSLGAKVILRCPIVPGVNDSEEHFKEIARLSSEYSSVEYAEVMPYHSIGRDKWKQIGLDYSFPAIETVSRSTAEEWRETIRGYGGKIK
jgi:glycyl-radical enzyme activating protein